MTDGGAVENRGAITLYFAVRETLRRPSPAENLARLRVVVADVSASDDRYAESFGFDSVLGAGGQLGPAPEGELLADLKEIYCGHESAIPVHEIAMPAVLRNGGIGTHWLLPGSLTFTDPKTGDRVTLSADDVKKLGVAHDSTAPIFDNPADWEISSLILVHPKGRTPLWSEFWTPIDIPEFARAPRSLQ
ncbi:MULTISPECIES: hypothetical protein [Sinorhizobium]|uniref:hypothetical protein n=1 Tax=Sinorhizobium TaxID=28105 RepID=UPI00040DF884|nr:MULTISPECIES: hypothetical protein [Sinorhizobium]WOS67181.1 hypothetical protein SFGR64A_30860 [Sinorhizobium fredii GR64]